MIIRGPQRNQDPSFRTETPGISKGLGNVTRSPLGALSVPDYPCSAQHALDPPAPVIKSGNVKKATVTKVEGTQAPKRILFK